MDVNIRKALTDKLYDKRKAGALDLEKAIRDALAQDDHQKIAEIIDQLCNEFAFVTHQPHARNGGLIGLAAASIALGSGVARYLRQICPPVLACFADQDARVRYYACESMYNIAKVAKGEVLVYFNEVFDALSKLAADSELSVKNGAELLDRLVKDIVSESAASYVSVLQTSEDALVDSASNEESYDRPEIPMAFSLSRFIPLLEQRIHVINPFTRTFLVGWVNLLDSIPDLELVSYLPSFLAGIFKFLSDPNEDVRVTTQTALERFLAEISRIARIKREMGRKRAIDIAVKRASSSVKSEEGQHSQIGKRLKIEETSPDAKQRKDINEIEPQENDSALTNSITINDESDSIEEDWIPGQDVQVDHSKILEILLTFLSDSSEQQIQLTALRWIDRFFEICPEDILTFVPRLLSHVLPALTSNIEHVRQAAARVNTSLRDYILTLSDGPHSPSAAAKDADHEQKPDAPLALAPTASKDVNGGERRDSVAARIATGGERRDPAYLARSHGQKLGSGELEMNGKLEAPDGQGLPHSSPVHSQEPVASPRNATDLDYEAAVGALTLQFLNEHEATRVAALAWLTMLHQRARGKIVAINEGTFPALLKTLSDPSEAVVTRDLQLLSQISRNSDDSYFSSFMVNLLKLFRTDRRLLEARGNLIIRQLCVTLSAERIYRTLAECLEKDEDIEFASIMVQNLNNNLITAPELADLRKRLRNLDNRDGQSFFVALFRSWCHNAVATFSLCLLAQAYEQAYYLLQVFADLEMTVNMLIQIDKLVQLLESPVFTYLRLQLLEPERYPHLYKCLYGLLMLLPQSSAFAALRNRLNSVSAIGYLHIAPRAYASSSTASPSLLHARQKSSDAPSSSGTPGANTSSAVAALSGFDRPGRLKSRDDGPVRWSELLDKFKATQERGRLSGQLLHMEGDDMSSAAGRSSITTIAQQEKEKKAAADASGYGRSGVPRPGSAASGGKPQPGPALGHRPKSSFSNLGRFATGMGKGVVKGRDKR